MSACLVNQPSIAGQLQGAGYETGFIGQWLLDGFEGSSVVPPGPRRHGFQYWAQAPAGAEGVEASYQTGLAINFLKQSRQNPFYLFLSWGRHEGSNPLVAPDTMQCARRWTTASTV